MADAGAWGNKPYYSFDAYCKSVYGEKVYKIALNIGCTCPVRDGTIHSDACIFCSAGGSGEFAAAPSGQTPDLPAQLAAGKERIRRKYGGSRFIAYLQPYTNTYGDPAYLKDCYTAALADEEVVGLSIATRPDCLGPEIMAVLDAVREDFPEKSLWIELGLQTIHRKTVQYIRRGYETSVFEEAVHTLHTHHIPVIVHVILGLPGEDRSQILTTIEYLNTFPIFGIKLQLLHVLMGTDLAKDYAERKFETLTRTEYIQLLIDCLEHLSPQTVIHRLTGDGPRDLLIAPLWSTDKKNILNQLLKEMERLGSYQGKAFSGADRFPIL
ncbi:MAG: TIGR01212 family radical SAM protein [Lachnospiraceae bacterium]|nr:TIGR01212 family radical SAM protein [Lachnospiraceae bacterium]